MSLLEKKYINFSSHTLYFKTILKTTWLPMTVFFIEQLLKILAKEHLQTAEQTTRVGSK